MSALLAVEGLRAGYGATEVLRGVDLDVAAGEIVAVLGSNGAGKSTLNHAISGLVITVRAMSAPPMRRRAVSRRADAASAIARDAASCAA